ncbi:WASH complex subunit 2 [Plakobranchus ocellatus]|uniref:WASH complex subunit 2 n=1 Tax=Plakobranchus ocellatus TaxID=259542 RepID=A0AAV4A3U3_9GAST|nr:WASH complex subunit 2 [Plakobranchus ocellatus]
MAAPAPPTNDGETITQTASTENSGQNGPLVWQRAWSIAEMRSGAGNWSLAGDAGLLLHLQEFSQQIISRTHEMGKDVDGLMHEAELTGVRVNNVINDFIMLANSQFVENRVYDEDVSQATENEEEKKSEEKEQTREEREASLIPRVMSALKLGVDVIDSAFEKLDTAVVDSDSEDEDTAYKAEPILEAKDPYITRPMPYLIGTPQFMEDDNVGLTEDVSEEEEESDQGSISVSEDEKESEDSETEYSSSDGSAEEDLKKHKKQRAPTKTSTSMNSDEDESDSDADMFNPKKSKAKKHDDDDDDDDEEAEGDEDEDEEDSDESSKKRSGGGGPSDFASELAARIGAAIPKLPAREENGPESGEDDAWADESVSRGKILWLVLTAIARIERETFGA